MDPAGRALRNLSMRVPLPDVGRRGRMDLTFVLQNDQTVLRHAYCEIPFKITRVLNSSQPVHLILMHCTAGLFVGDDVDCSIRVERGARVQITQQSATKIHPSDGRPAIQRNHVLVESGAELRLYLEPVIPFAGSRLRQATRIDVEPGGRLVFWEGFIAAEKRLRAPSDNAKTCVVFPSSARRGILRKCRKAGQTRQKCNPSRFGGLMFSRIYLLAGALLTRAKLRILPAKMETTMKST